MSDDWSLDGKLRQCDPSKAVKILGKPIRHYFYGPNDIETLRQKLIEDIKKLEYQYSHSLAETNGIEGYLSGFDEAKDYIKIIINKRFGKEGD